jgi:hypothetical protein
MNNSFIKHLLVILIIFSNHSFGKEFEELFTINVPIENSSKIESSINQSFNSLVFRISGSKSPSNIWKIINSGSSRKDFIESYSIKYLNDKSYLEVNFNQSLVIDKFKELSIPIIGHSRPVIFFLINVESGSGASYYISQDSKNEIDIYIKESLDKLSNERGLFLELPLLDLADKTFLSNASILTSPQQYLISKYDFNEYVDIKLINLGLKKWLIKGDINTDFNEEYYLEDIKQSLDDYLESLINVTFSDLKIDTSKTILLDVSIEGINSYEDYEILKEKLSKIIAITNLEILNLKKGTISYKINVMGDINNFKKSIENNTFFEFLPKKTENNLSLRFVK